MNLIELSNQLKDVPDQFLMKEVQAPSGAYPAYMVITELTRRKRMRDSAAKEMPETTVAEDLVGEQERARAMAQVQNQMAQAQPMIPPQGSLNAAGGLGALPEAQGSLAAQDAMGTTPPEMMMPTQNMAGGGMVSFKEGGNVIRAYDGLPDSMFSDPETAFFMGATRAEENEENEKQKKLEEMYRRYEKGQQQAADIRSGRTVLDRGLAESRIGKKGAEELRAASAPPVAAPAVVPVATAPVAAPSPELTRLKNISSNTPKLPTLAELDARSAAGQTEFAEKVPYRFGFLGDQLKSEAAKLQGREQSNINEALIQAGLGIMGSKSPRFLQAVSEGGLSALRGYKEGLKDIRDSERALMQSRIKAAEAQSLYDRDKFAAGDKARSQSLEYAKTAATLNDSESANLARTLQGQVALSREAREAAESPSKIAYTQALANQANALAAMKQAPTSPEILAARAMVGADLKKSLGRDPNKAEIENALESYFKAQNKVYTPQGVAGIPGTGAKFLGFEK